MDKQNIIDKLDKLTEIDNILEKKLAICYAALSYLKKLYMDSVNNYRILVDESKLT